MKTKTFVQFLAVASWLAAGTAMFAQTTAFTYHGRLNNNGTAVTGAYDMRFSIYDGDVGNGLVAGPLPVNALGVTNGLFTARIDLGAGVFTGPPRWLELSVRPAGSGNFTTLGPRQELMSSPYAIRAQSAGTAADVSNGSVVKSLNNLRDNVTLAAGANVTLTPNGNTLTIASTGGVGGVWSLNGNNAFYNGGNVGIGTSNPMEQLTIAGVSSYNNGLKLTGNADAGTGLALENTSAGGHKYALLSGGSADGVGVGGLGIYDDTVGDYRLAISAAGNVGIGTAVPQAKLDVAGTIRLAGSIVDRVEIATQDALRIKGFQPFITMYDTSAFGLIFPPRRYIQVVGDGMHFLYQPECNTIPCPTGNAVAQLSLSGNGNVGIGTTTPQAKLDVIGTTRTSILTITGGGDIAEPFKMSSDEIPKGSVVVIDEQNPGHLKMSTTAYDTRVAGVVSGANGIKPGISLYQEGAMEGGENVALSGRVYVQADAATGAIHPGDLLTTSGTPGHAMKVGDHAKAQGAILGKAMSSLKEGKGMVLVLVTLQ
jgi:hypothetical protein